MSSDEIQRLLPQEFRDLSLDAESLPGNVHPIAYPFLSVVVNLNVATLGHRDSKDKGFCVVIAIGDFENGELCLYEPGLILMEIHVVFPAVTLPVGPLIDLSVCMKNN